MKDSKVEIFPQKNGSYFVKNCKKFTNSRNEPVTIKNPMVLCRCGASKTKPFCDGSHIRTGFTDEKDKNLLPDKRDSYFGEKITIHKNRGICAHVGYCARGLPAVFAPGEGRGIDPDAASVDEIIEVINKG